MSKKLLALYGLKYNPFISDIPVEALSVYPKLENFCWRVEQSLVREGGFALVSGDPGTGKSVALRVLADRLSRVRVRTSKQIRLCLNYFANETRLFCK